MPWADRPPGVETHGGKSVGCMVTYSGWSGRAGTVDFCEIPHPSLKRGKCRVDGGGYFVGKRRAWPEKEKGSNFWKTVKFRKLHMKFFFPFPPGPATLTPKWSPYPCYLAQPSRKQKKTHTITLKMDQEKAFFQSYIYRGLWPDSVLIWSAQLVNLRVAENGHQKLQSLPSKGGNVEWTEVIILWVSVEHGRKWEKGQIFEKLKKSENYLWKNFPLFSYPGRTLCQNDPQGCFT
jgi:hypothetical protein